MTAFEIAGHRIGPGEPVFIIAEAGVNHNGDVNLAKKLIDAAVDAGADAVKFQSFTAEQLVSPEAPKAEYQARVTDQDESQFDMLKRLELSDEDHRVLAAHCRDRGVLFLSTPFDESNADRLDALDVPVFKVSSGEVTNLPLLAHIGAKNRPVILSTGMSTLGEVESAVATLEAAGATGVALLHCVSDYPAEPADVNLRAMRTMAAAFGLPVGYSDHVLGNEVCLAAVALGARVLEKHLTLDRALPGPDHRASAAPDEFSALVKATRAVEAALGDGRKRPTRSEREIAAVARRSLVAAADIPSGAVIKDEMLTLRRPGTGLPPALQAQLVGRMTCTAIPAGTVISLEMLS